jgi:hypothetical protein
MKRLLFQRLAVVHVSLGEHKIKYFTPVVDNQVKFKTKEPANRTLTFGGQSFEYLIGMLPPDMAYFQRGRINKRYSGTLTQTRGFQKDSHWHGCFLLKFNKTIVGYKTREFLSQMLTYIVKIKCLRLRNWPS